MIHPSDFETRIGFDRIRRQVENLCVTRLAKEKLADTGFGRSYDLISMRLDQTDQMKNVLMMESGFPQEGFADIHHFLNKIRLEGSHIDVEEMIDLKKALEAVKALTTFFGERKEGTYPALRALAGTVTAHPAILHRIEEIIDRFGKIRDNASAGLRDIRRQLADREREVGKRLQQIMRSAQAQGVVEEDVSISIRDGRAVIPVPAANKRKIKGFVHDESATGKTVYMEPVEVVELNNEIKELEYAERREIIRILTAFSDFLRPYMEELMHSGDFLAEIDLLCAKAKQAVGMNAAKPLLVDYPHIELRKARHPLLEQTLKKEGKNIVPLDLTLTREKHILVISGPNAGGKSVCLKTVGLLQYMLQCGFLIPASENSEMGLFKSIFVDIGDQQSIENDLSTYSSHLENMKTVLRHSDAQSLVLIDEFGAGTEPALGGAIAEAVLEKLELRGTFGLITTHYSNLKYYASTAKGILNGAMAFDVQHILPLFRLETGKPGSSFAFELARKIGLPEEIIRSASEKIGTGQVNIEKQLREIARDKRYWEEKRDRIRLAEKRVDELAQKYQKELEQIQEQRSQLIREAKTEARTILQDSNRIIENTVREIRESQAEKERTRRARVELEQFKRQVEEAEKSEEDLIERKIEQLKEKEKRRREKKSHRPSTDSEISSTDQLPQKPKATLEVGDKVRIKGQEMAGEILSVDGKKYTIAFGQLTTIVPKEKLEHISNADYKKQLKSAKPAFTGGLGKEEQFTSNYDLSQKRLDFKQQIDIRGMRVNDALIAVQDFVDEALVLGIPEVKILHGKGTGALKEEIRKLLRTMPLVKSAEDEDVRFGGAGITVVALNG